MTLRSLWILLRLFAFASIGLAFAANADSWVPPHRKVYESLHHRARLIVTPHFPPRDRAPFVGEPRGPSAPDMAHAILQRRDGRGHWVVQWQGRLANEVAPCDALVADSGHYFVTFDDWGDVGYGPNVLVIYNGDGRKIRALSILDLLPRDYVDALPHSISIIRWEHGAHRFAQNGEQLLLSMAIPSLTDSLFPEDGFELAVDLATGAVTQRGPAWDHAMVAGAASRVAARERRAAYARFMTEPLVAPDSAAAQSWATYLDEAFGRLAPDWDRNNPTHILLGVSTTGLTWRSTSDAGSVLLRRDRPLAIMIASPTGLSIPTALAPIVSGRPRNWLHGIRLYVVANDASWPEVQRLLGPTGATLVQIDPTRPIPQRPERLRTLLPVDQTP